MQNVTMQCAIPSQNMRILVRAFHSLSRIGDDVYIESAEDKLCFRTVNAAQSAYSSVTFYIPFFIQYKSDYKTDEGGKCKLSMKAILSVFKTPHCMDRNVDSGQIVIDEECVKVSFQIRFMQGYTKNYYLNVSDNANVQLKYNKDEMCNKMNILSKTLFGAIKHFRANDEEITLSVKTDTASLRNYFCDVESDSQKVVRTNLSLQPSEFEVYDIHLAGSITFTLREIKAVCTFSELSNSSPVSIYFEKAGKPVIFSVRNDQLYEADYVVSTLPPEMMSGERPHRRSQLSDVVSSVPSTTSGVTGGNKKRKLIPITEEVEPACSSGSNKKKDVCSPMPRVSLVDIIRYSDEFRQSPVRPSPISSTVNENSQHAPVTMNSLQSSMKVDMAHVSVQQQKPSLTKTASNDINDIDFFPDDVNNECLQMICDQVDELTRSQLGRIHTVFQHCYNYSAKSQVIAQEEVLCNSSDVDIEV